MTADPLGVLLEGLVSERRAREARLQGLADRLLGRSAPAAPVEVVATDVPSLPAPSEPFPQTSPDTSPAEDSSIPFQEALLALRAEKEVLLRKNAGLEERLRERQELPQAPQALLGQSSLEAAPVEDPSAPFREALLALRTEKEALLQKNLALYDDLQRLQAAEGTKEDLRPRVMELEDRHRELEELLKAERESADQARAALASAQAALAVAQAELRARDDALSGLRAELLSRRRPDPQLSERSRDVLEVKARLEVALRSADVRAAVFEETLRKREQAWADERQRLERDRRDLSEALSAAQVVPLPTKVEPLQASTQQAWEAFVGELMRKS